MPVWKESILYYAYVQYKLNRNEEETIDMEKKR